MIESGDLGIPHSTFHLFKIFLWHTFLSPSRIVAKAKMSEKEISEKGDPEIANARSDTSISNKDVSDSEHEVVDWTPEEERSLVRK